MWIQIQGRIRSQSRIRVKTRIRVQRKRQEYGIRIQQNPQIPIQQSTRIQCPDQAKKEDPDLINSRILIACVRVFFFVVKVVHNKCAKRVCYFALYLYMKLTFCNSAYMTMWAQADKEWKYSKTYFQVGINLP